VYDEEPLAHRVVVITETAALVGEFGTYLVRTLLSEGRLLYGSVGKTGDGRIIGRRIEKEGPTAVLLTTTAVKLHSENETRMLSVPVDDTREQTQAVMASLAKGAESLHVDLDEWLAFQEWLEGGEREVMVPFAELLARKIPPVAVRLRRDFAALLSLICAHALLHRATRDRDGYGRVVATLDDYDVVRELVVDLMGDAVSSSVSPTVRATVEAVATRMEAGAESVSVTELGQTLEVDKATASRRYRVALERGYLRNLEDKRGKPARLVLGEALPEDVPLLPTVEALRGCGVAGGGREHTHSEPPCDQPETERVCVPSPPLQHSNTATPDGQDSSDALAVERNGATPAGPPDDDPDDPWHEGSEPPREPLEFEPAEGGTPDRPAASEGAGADGEPGGNPDVEVFDL